MSGENHLAAPRTSQKRPLDIAGIVLGSLALQASIAAPLLAILLAGAGHGWCAAIQVSWITVFMGPLTIVGAVFRRQYWALAISCVLLGLMASADHTLMARTRGEQEYFERVWEQAPVLVVGWFAAWVMVHAVLLVAIIWWPVAATLAAWREPSATQCDPDDPYKPTY
jgi:hypothetical protein